MVCEEMLACGLVKDASQRPTVQALLRLLWISITIVPIKKKGSRLTEHDAPKVKLKACQEACAHLQHVFMPSLATGTDPKLHEAIAGLETGKRYKGAHLQTGW